MELVQNADGVWEEKKEPFAVIEVATEEDFKFFEAAIEHYREFLKTQEVESHEGRKNQNENQ